MCFNNNAFPCSSDNMLWTQYIASTSHVYNVDTNSNHVNIYSQQTFIILLCVISALYYCAVGFNRFQSTHYSFWSMSTKIQIHYTGRFCLNMKSHQFYFYLHKRKSSIDLNRTASFRTMNINKWLYLSISELKLFIISMDILRYSISTGYFVYIKCD